MKNCNETADILQATQHETDAARWEGAGWGEYCPPLEPIRSQDIYRKPAAHELGEN